MFGLLKIENNRENWEKMDKERLYIKTKFNIQLFSCTDLTFVYGFQVLHFGSCVDQKRI